MSDKTTTIDFDKMDGLVAGIVQDARTGEVLMLGFLNPASYAKTLESGYVTFWSRTRQKLWMKGETSGNRLRVVSASSDCDNDTLLFRVEVEGDGLVPGIVQDARTGEVLMLGFLNPASYAKTLESGFVTFWSRTRQKLWMKGETSGNRLRIVSAATDCDNDTLLFRVVVEGDGLVCHEGTVSCFTKPIAISAEVSRG